LRRTHARENARKGIVSEELQQEWQPKQVKQQATDRERARTAAISIRAQKSPADSTNKTARREGGPTWADPTGHGVQSSLPYPEA
jgi:hypothetical protein